MLSREDTGGTGKKLFEYFYVDCRARQENAEKYFPAIIVRRHTVHLPAVQCSGGLVELGAFGKECTF